MVDLTHWVQVVGYLGVFTALFLQTGLLLGFFLPGDSLLFTAGFLASQHYFDITLLTLMSTVVAFFGYWVAYTIGQRFREHFQKNQDGRFVKKKHIEQAAIFYKQHGGKALVLGRLVPIVRTFIPVIAGVTNMSLRRFMRYNAIGALVWATGITLLGYFLGEAVPGVEHYILPAVLVVIVISLLPAVVHMWRERRGQRHA